MSVAFRTSRRRIVAAGGLLAAARIGTIAFPAGAQPAFPSRPIRLIVPFPPGGSVTVVARLLADRLSQRIGQPVVVDNKPGGNGVIASEDLLKSAPDGHTVLLVVNTHVINPSIMPSMPFDVRRDFAAVSGVYKLELMLVAHPSVPAANLREFVAIAKAQPDSINFAAGDNAGLTHLAAETFNSVAGTRLRVVPYKGTGPALNDTLGGHVQAYFSSITPVIQHVKSGKLKAFGVSGRARAPALPEVPTFAEAGLANFEAGTWCGMLAPAATPRPVVSRLATEVAAVMNLPEVRDTLVNQGLEAMPTAPEQFDALLRADLTRLSTVIKAAGIKGE
jgi:tripartite-type tricarboxylate transporter receptor subunit TctC